MINPQSFFLNNISKNDFISVWDTRITASGTSASNQVVLPFTNSSPCTIYWGDGTSTVYDGSTASRTHTYAVAGIYTIVVRGSLLPLFRFTYVGDRTKILKILKFGGFRSNAIQIFGGCSNLYFNDVVDYPRYGILTDSVFNNCPIGFIPNINKWVVLNSNLTNCFNNCSQFNQDISGIDFSGVTNMTGMLANNPLFNQDISNINFNKNVILQNLLGGKTAATYNAQYLANLYVKMAATFIGTGRTQTNKNFSAGSAKYHSSGSSARTALVADGWTLTDGGVL